MGIKTLNTSCFVKLRDIQKEEIFRYKMAKSICTLKQRICHNLAGMTRNYHILPHITNTNNLALELTDVKHTYLGNSLKFLLIQ